MNPIRPSLDRLRLELRGGEVAALDRQVAEQPLLVRLLDDVLLDGALGDEPVDVDVPRLPDPVAPVLRLRVHRRVPVGVVEDDGVGAGEVDADAAGPGRQDEDEVLLVAVEALHERLALLHLGRTVESGRG